ncbi:DNA polymerase epsilon subunit 4 [Procambarus clarkii]|uniref:DNA polymerase epsilon subunit 4 n=1 Tax=Procambarus clarkii TaxID=6728 RepID=UPI001E67260D|nr:DNA polymerase epsilon subunit 4-like [Procambarus clarkii]
MAGDQQPQGDAMEASEDVGVDADEEKGSGLRLPLARVKKIMKADPDLNLASQDAVYLITKATELFVESLVQEAYHYTCQARKKTVSRRDVDNSIEAIEALAFLDGALE